MSILDKSIVLRGDKDIHDKYYFSLREVLKEILEDEELSELLGQAIMKAPIGRTNKDFLSEEWIKSRSSPKH